MDADKIQEVGEAISSMGRAMMSLTISLFMLICIGACLYIMLK